MYKYEENFGTLKVGKIYILKMDAPDPENPNAQGNSNQDPDQNQGQVPTGQVPIPQLVPAQLASCWCHACSSDYLSKLDRPETRIFR